MKKENLVGVILAAGKGTRMAPFSQRFPKPLLPICNRPILEYQVEYMKRAGIQEIIVATMGPIGNPYSSGSVHVLDINGNELPGWPVTIASRPISGAAVAVGDLDANDDVELVAQAWYGVYVWNHDGSTFPSWPKATGTSWSASPALADLDDDGDLEIIAPITNAMHAWHHNATEAAGWPRSAVETEAVNPDRRKFDVCTFRSTAVFSVTARR